MNEEIAANGHGPERLPASELADRLERIPTNEAVELARRVPAEELAKVILEVETSVASQILAQFPIEAALSLLAQVPPNAAADLIALWPAGQQRAILTGLGPEKAGAIAALLPYPADSAGGVMDSRFIAVAGDDTIDQCLARIRNAPRALPSDEVSYIYVVDSAQHLAGVVSLRDLVFNAPSRRVNEVMQREVRFVRVDDDQEEVARRIRQERLLALPVLDALGRLVGTVRIRDAARVAEAEATEDMQLMVGISGEEHIWTPWRRAIGMRLPWLGVNLVTATSAAVVVSLFEGTIARWTALVAFLPLICAVAGNAGNQALTVLVRSFALGEVTAGDVSRAFRKELQIGAVNGLVLAIAIGALAITWKRSILLAVVAGAAMLLNQVLGAISGVAIPLALRWRRVDPALAASILVTALTDTMGFLLFLGLASVGSSYLTQ